LAARFVRDEEAAGSNPATPTSSEGVSAESHHHAPPDNSTGARWQRSFRVTCTAIHCPHRRAGRRDGLDRWPATGPRRPPGPGPPRTIPARSSPRLPSTPIQEHLEGPATDSTPGLDPRARPCGGPDNFRRCGHLDHLPDHRDALARYGCPTTGVTLWRAWREGPYRWVAAYGAVPFSPPRSPVVFAGVSSLRVREFAAARSVRWM
jgi:hypothetical protein